MFHWYVINTYSGHENKVRQNLLHRVETMGQQQKIRRVVVPTEQVVETKDGQKVQVEKRTLPGHAGDPCRRSSCSAGADQLLVDELVGPVAAELASEAGLLITSPWRFDVGGLHVIDPDDSGTQRLYGAHGFVDVARPDRGGESVRRIVGDFHRVFFAFEWNHRSDWTEDLFAGDAG